MVCRETSDVDREKPFGTHKYTVCAKWSTLLLNLAVRVVNTVLERLRNCSLRIII
jgi:hypothetical protein